MLTKSIPNLSMPKYCKVFQIMKESKRVLFYHFMTTYVQVIVIM